MATRAERATSFGAIADQYNRLRSGPPASAVEWLLEPGCQVAVDLAAGTGLLTRSMAAQAASVVAVEPDERMRAVLRTLSDGVHVVAGVGEALPLRDGVADGLFISSAWHWMDPERAVPEIARVLRDGGRFGVIWTSRDRESGWLHDLDLAHAASEVDPAAGTRRGHHEVELPEGAPFTEIETRSFAFGRAMTIDDFVDMYATTSRLITASPRDRATELARMRAALRERFPDAAQIDVPMRSRCWRADRVRRYP
jgi:SAM-dependent methyltransferase